LICFQKINFYQTTSSIIPIWVLCEKTRKTPLKNKTEKKNFEKLKFRKKIEGVEGEGKDEGKDEGVVFRDFFFNISKF